MKVLFIGGTGVISSACGALAAEKGMELHLLNRGKTQRRPLPAGARLIHADIHDRPGAERALAGQTFDAVVDWVAFTPEEIEGDIELFRGRTEQFIFISSAVVYHKPPTPYAVTESAPIRNPDWKYARDKIACEERLQRAFREERFPITIVRPSHTYDTNIPAAIGGRDYTVVDRMKRGRKVIVHGDGTSLWTLTHSEDFAKAFAGLLGNRLAIGHAFHITSDEVLTWNQVYQTIGEAAGATPDLIHIPSDFIARFDHAAGESLLGDKAHCAVFDNSKIKRFVPGFQATIPFAEGIRRTLAWFDADPSRKTVNAAANAAMDAIIAAYGKALEGVDS